MSIVSHCDGHSKWTIQILSVCCPAAFFQDCISEQDLDEMNIEIIRNTLYKVKLVQLV